MPSLLGDAEIQQIEPKMRPRKILRGEVGDPSGLLFFVGLNRAYAMTEHPRAYRQRQCGVEVVARSNGRHPSETVKEIVKERLLDVFYLQAGTGSAEPR